MDGYRDVSERGGTEGFPLVLHGGSGTGDENLRKASRMGINKVNVGTDLFKASLHAVRSADLEGGNIYNIWQVINDSWRDKLIYWIELLGSAGKAREYLPKDKEEKKPWQMLAADKINKAI